jgi:hypothetical protein
LIRLAIPRSLRVSFRTPTAANYFTVLERHGLSKTVAELRRMMEV